MKIVHVAEYASGGIATYIRNTISYQLKDEQVESIDLFISDFNSEVISFDDSKFHVYRYNYQRNFAKIWQLYKLIPLIIKNNPDIIHFHSTFAGLLRPLIKFITLTKKTSIVYTSHGWSFCKEDVNYLKKIIFFMIELFLSFFTDSIVNVSKHDYEVTTKRGFNHKKSYVVYNTIQPYVTIFPVDNPFNKSNSYKLCFAGRFDKAKGLDFLLNNFDFDNSNIELMIIGKPVLNDINIAIKNTKHIHFLGWIENIELASYIKLCDAVIIPSRWEAFGITALESMRSSKMVISSDAGGLTEIVINNYNGLIFEKDNAKSLNLILDAFQKMSSKEIKQMGANAQITFSTDFNYKKNNLKLMKIYKKDINNG